MTDEENQLVREVLRDMAVKVHDLNDKVDEWQTDRESMMRMLRDLHDALMKPQPGHSRPLLERMASVTIAAETGKAAGERVIWWAKVFAAVGAIVSGFYAAVKFGHPPK